MAGEVAETSKLFARQVAGVQPEWIEQLADHLLQRSYRDAHWQRRQGRVAAYEQSTLHGLIINPKKRVDYSRINPVECRQIFIRDALVAGNLQTGGEFYRYNLALLDEVTTLEEKSRRRDIVVDPLELVRFYDAIIPEEVSNAADFEKFRKRYESEHPRGLYFSRDMLLAEDAVDVTARDYPDQLDAGGLVLPLRYHFAPGEEDDGVTLACPVEVINRVPAARCEWLVPGMLEEKITLMIKMLPKVLRRNFVPAPDFATAACEAMPFGEGSLTSALSRHLQRMTGVEVKQADWGSIVELPRHLQMRFELIDAEGQVLRAGRDLPALQREHVGQVEETLLQFSDQSIERDTVTHWNFGDLPESVDIERQGATLQGFPALQAGRHGVSIKLFASEGAAARAMPLGVRALYRLVLNEEIRYLRRKLPGINVLALRFTPYGTKEVLITDVIDAAIDAVFIDPQALPRTREAFEAALQQGRKALVAQANEIAENLAQIFEAHRQVARRIEGSIALSWVEAAADVRDQIDALLYAGFVTATGASRLKRLPVYFQGMDKRLDAIDRAPDKDRRRRAEFLPVWERFKALPVIMENDPEHAIRREALRWSFEELRLSLFAQELGAREKVSVSRLENRVQALADPVAAGVVNA